MPAPDASENSLLNAEQGLRWRPEQQGHVASVEKEKKNGLAPDDLPSRIGNQDQQDGSSSHHPIVELQDLGRNGKRPDDRGCPKNEEQIEDVGAEDIADGDIAVPAQGGADRGGEFGQGGAHSHDRDADHSFRNARHDRQFDRRLDQQASTEDDARKAEDRKKDGPPDWPSYRLYDRCFRSVLAFDPATLLAEIAMDEVGCQQRNEEQAHPAADVVA